MTSSGKLFFCAFIVLVAGVSGCDDDKKSVNPDPGFPVLTVNLDFEFHYLDLETGNIDTVAFPSDPVTAEMDFKIAYNADTTPHSVVFQQRTLGRMIAHLPNRTFASVTASDTAGAPVTSSLVGDPFDASRVILLKTDSANVYKLGNPVETANSADGLTFDYQKLTSGP